MKQNKNFTRTACEKSAVLKRGIENSMGKMEVCNVRKSLLILILAVLVITSTPAMAGGEKTDVDPVGSLDFTDKVVYFLDHTSNPDKGNWITLGSPSDETRVQLPEPIKITYNGPKHEEYGGVAGTLYIKDKKSYTITYPSTSSYATHPVYLPDENVTMSFHGESGLEGNVDIYLFKVTSDSAHDLLDAFKAGDIGDLNELFEDSVDGNYEKYSTKLDHDGDISQYDLGRPGAGQYLIVMVQQNRDESMTVLSTTAFIVARHELCISAPSSIEKGKNLDISMTLKGASNENECTYGALLIKEQAYKANIEVNSDGTKDGTSVIVNDVDLVDEFDINSSNYRSKLTKNELQTEIQTLIGEGNGAIAVGEAGQEELSLTSFDLPVGRYYLLVGAYSPGKGLVGLAQEEIKIKPKESSNGDGNSGNDGGNSGNDGDNSGNNGGNSGGNSHNSGGGGGAGSSPEPAKNVKTKELCQQFVSNGNRIKFEFTKEATSIGYIEFDGKKNAGKITTIIEELKGRSSLTPEDPKGTVYEYLNIWVGNGGFANSKNIENAVVGFKVSKEWITENHIDIDTIILQHFNEKQWESLKTEKVGEDDGYIYFKANTPGFSPFAITASESILEIGGKIEESKGQSISEFKQPETSELDVEAEVPSKENGSLLTRIASFFIGFLIIILMGTAIMKRVNLNNKGTNSEDMSSEDKSSEDVSFEK
jgi:methanogen extracellular protein (TIGR04279 family)/PGF-pre-PGF domain-containing protein